MLTIMDLEAFSSSPVGQLIPISGFDSRFAELFEARAFLPTALPDTVHLDPATVFAVTNATAAVARLDQAAFRLPNLCCLPDRRSVARQSAPPPWRHVRHLRRGP